METFFDNNKQNNISMLPSQARQAVKELYQPLFDAIDVLRKAPLLTEDHDHAPAIGNVK